MSVKATANVDSNMYVITKGPEGLKITHAKYEGELPISRGSLLELIQKSLDVASGKEFTLPACDAADITDAHMNTVMKLSVVANELISKAK